MRRKDLIDWDLVIYQSRYLHLLAAQIGSYFGTCPETIRRGLKRLGAYKRVLLKNGVPRKDWSYSYKNCIICGNGFSGAPNAIFCEQCKELPKKQRLKIRAFERLGGSVCHNCGITDFALLEIGHMFGNGSEHGKALPGNAQRSDKIRWWILKTSDEEIKKWGIAVECVMCNQFYRYKGKYPTHEERKQWSELALTLR